MNEKKHDLSFLHTDDMHVPTFQGLADALCPNATVRHEVRADLLETAQKQGTTPALQESVASAMRTAADSGASIVVCTCSSIGGMAEHAGEGQGFTSTRIDRAMADKAVLSGDKILVVAALESTLQPTRELLDSSAKRNGVSPAIDAQTVDQSWDFFKTGDLEGYFSAIENHIRDNYQDYPVVVLAQASMAPVDARCADLPIEVLSSPKLGVMFAADKLNS